MPHAATNLDDHPPPAALIYDPEALAEELLSSETTHGASAYRASIQERAGNFPDAVKLSATMADEIEALHKTMDALDAATLERVGQVAIAREALHAERNALSDQIALLDQEIAMLEQRCEDGKTSHRWSIGWRLGRLYQYACDFWRELRLGKKASSLKLPAGTLTFYRNPSRLEWIREIIDHQAAGDPGDGQEHEGEGKRDDQAILESLAVLSRLGLYDHHQRYVRTTVEPRLDDLKAVLTVSPGECWFELIVTAKEMTQEIADAAKEGWVLAKPGSINTATAEVLNWVVRIPAMYERRTEGGEITIRSPILRRIAPETPYNLGWKRARPSTAKEATTTDD